MTDPYQSQIELTGKRIFQLLENDSQSIFNKDWWYGRIMEWSMKNEDFKTKMFRFVDVLPYLNSSEEVARHLKEYFTHDGGEMPKVFGMGLGLGTLAPGLLAGAVKKNVTQMAKMFIAGDSPQEALGVLKKQRKAGIGFTVDLLGEVTLSEKEAQSYQRQYTDLIEWLARDSKNWETYPQLDSDSWGEIPKVNVSVKLSTLYSQMSVEAWDETISILKDRLRPILRTAVQNNVFLNVDMEHYDIKNLTLQVFKEIIAEPEFKNYPHFGIVLQAYLRDSFEDVRQMIDFAKSRKTPFSIRLVKGAYWDYETIISEQRGWPCPVYKNKKESDANYEDCLEELLKNAKWIKTAIGSHNVRSISAAIVMAEKYSVPKNAIEIQMLYGMADSIKRALVQMGYRVREYAPVGELIPGMAYLVRRLLENTSNESFLRSKFAEHADAERLLEDPHRTLNRTNPDPSSKDFRNEPLLDFNDSRNRAELAQWIQKLSNSAPLSAGPVIGNKKISTSDLFHRENPSHSEKLIGKIQFADKNLTESAMTAAKEAFRTWRHTSPEDRAKLLTALADEIKRRRFELTAIEVLEVGKPWHEADGDITEAIDFCRYYAKQMTVLADGKRLGGVPGEVTHYHYQPRGVAVVIAPWNFPLAILAGMTVAAAVAGNTVIMKPAEQSSVIAGVLMDMMIHVGFPPGVVNLVTGRGEDVGEYLVQHKDTSLIAFTGSREVGLHILKQASVVQPGQNHVKRCIIEMGGKNAIIIDADADLDEAVDGALYAAFGFQGQKCSACSRIIILESAYDRFVDRFLEAAGSITVGFAEDPKTYVGPLVDRESQTRVLKSIESGKSVGKLAFSGHAPSEGYFVPPTVFIDADPQSDLGQKEFFAPVVSLFKARDLDHAIEIANGTEYALTGGVYSRSPASIEKVVRNFEVGNLYVNRSITGAMVERHPFGGFKMSGIGSKAGGPDYLLQFLEPRSVVENTLRRGFAPKEDEPRESSKS